MDLSKLTPANYKVPKGEELYYHCLIEVKAFNQKTGQKLSEPRVQKFGRKAFEQFIYDNLLKQGYTVTILHNPGEYLAKKASEVENAAKEKAEQEQKAKDEAFKKAVDEEVARRLAALKTPEALKVGQKAPKAPEAPKEEEKPAEPKAE